MRGRGPNSSDTEKENFASPKEWGEFLDWYWNY